MRIIVLLLTALFIFHFIAGFGRANDTFVTNDPQNIIPNVNNQLNKKVNETKPWWLGDLITLLGIAISATTILYQLRRQHKNELALQKENFREKLRLKVYREFSPALKAANGKIGSARMYAFRIPTQIKLHLDLLSTGINPPPIKERAKEFAKLHDDAIKSVIKLIFLFEKYEVVSPELNIFKLALNVASYDMSEGITSIYPFLIKILPMDITDSSGISRVVNMHRPTESQLQQLDDLVGVYTKANDELINYLYDLNVELQNIFLSKLFNNKVPRRQPLDPKIKVISTESKEEIEKLRKYFEEETNWGRNKQRSKQEVLNKLNNP